MSTFDPSDRDELVAAYLDGEATEAERSVVEADPELLARAELLRQVADLVAEPVMAPPAAVRRDHIAAALAASTTAPNVTSLATRRRRFDAAKVASIAAVVLAILAVPIVLLQGNGDDDDTAASSAAEDSVDLGQLDAESSAAADGGSAADAAAPAATPPAESLTAEAPADEAAAEEAGTFAADDDVSGDDGAAEAAAPEDEAAPEAEPAEEGAADAAGGERAVEIEARYDPPPVDDVTSLADEILAAVERGDIAIDPEVTDLDQFDCVGGFLAADDSVGFLPGVFAGRTTVADQPIEYVVGENQDGLVLVVLDADCAVGTVEILG